MTFESTHALVEQVAQAVHELRITLENHALPGLEAAILNSQMPSIFNTSSPCIEDF